MYYWHIVVTTRVFRLWMCHIVMAVLLYYYLCCGPSYDLFYFAAVFAMFAHIGARKTGVFTECQMEYNLADGI